MNNEWCILWHRDRTTQRATIVRLFYSTFAKLSYLHRDLLPIIFAVSELEEKREILRKLFTERQKQICSGGCQELELFAAILESDSDELIKRVVQRINLIIGTFGTNVAHVVSSIMSRCNGLCCFVLLADYINDESLEIMSQNLKGKQIHVSFSFPVCANRFLFGCHETVYSDWNF